MSCQPALQEPIVVHSLFGDCCLLWVTNSGSPGIVSGRGFGSGSCSCTVGSWHRRQSKDGCDGGSSSSKVSGLFIA